MGIQTTFRCYQDQSCMIFALLFHCFFSCDLSLYCYFFQLIVVKPFGLMTYQATASSLSQSLNCSFDSSPRAQKCISHLYQAKEFPKRIKRKDVQTPSSVLQ